MTRTRNAECGIKEQMTTGNRPLTTTHERSQIRLPPIAEEPRLHRPPSAVSPPRPGPVPAALLQKTGPRSAVLLRRTGRGRAHARAGHRCEHRYFLSATASAIGIVCKTGYKS